MSYCDLEKINADEIPVGKLIGMIAKAQKIYYNNMLNELNINNSQLLILFEVSKESNINQEKISSRCNTNKGAVARSIKKLEDNGFITRTIDENNRRQNIISLTKKGSETLKEASRRLKDIENYLFDNDNDKKELQILLKDLAIKMIALNEDGLKR